MNTIRWRQASSVYDMSNWHDLCFAARREAEILFRSHTGVKKFTASIAEKAALVSDGLLQQFKSRIANAQLGDKESLENERRFEQMFSDLQKKAILNPHLYIDSVGVVFLSGEMLFFDPPEDEF